MINFRVIDLDRLLAKLRAKEVTMVGERTKKSDFVYFAWAMDRKKTGSNCGNTSRA